MGARRLGSRGWILLILITAATVFGSLFARAEELARSAARIGFVGPQSPSTALRGINLFWERLRGLDYAQAQTLVVEERWAEARYDRLPALMTGARGPKTG